MILDKNFQNSSDKSTSTFQEKIMAQRSSDEILRKIINLELSAIDGIPALIDKKQMKMLIEEGQFIDFKRMLLLNEQSSCAELSRDILGFSNSTGGLLLFGVDDDGNVIGSNQIDPKILREKTGIYFGTRVNFEFDSILVGNKTIHYILIPKNTGLHPHLLRKDIELKGLLRKLKYAQGSLFFRKNDQTLVEPQDGNIEERASELGFTGSTARTRSSFRFAVDKIGIRLYAPTSERFIGREDEISSVVSVFDDIRGRGVSLSGLGGVGKTELAIHIVTELHKRKKFSFYYSGSSKQTLLGISGHQQIDPVFDDYESFLKDIGAWLGVELGDNAIEELEKEIIQKLKSIGGDVLLFIDNLETVEDRRIFEFMDDKIPSNCWLLTTSRIHKIKNYIKHIQIEPLKPESAAKLLRSELKNVGLHKFADSEIKMIQAYANQLHGHPLGIKFFCWSCKKNNSLWQKGPTSVPLENLESFCVAHTLENLNEASRVVLCSLIAILGQADATPDCISVVSGYSGDVLDEALLELESSGMVNVDLEDGTGRPFYLVAPLAEKPARDLGQKQGWEPNFVKRLKSHKSSKNTKKDDPRVVSLRTYYPSNISRLSKSEKENFLQKISRILELANENDYPILISLQAECLRHSENLASADAKYKIAADHILVLNVNIEAYKKRYFSILLEAATVARSRGSIHSIPAARIISYLEFIGGIDNKHPRVVGMLAEAYCKNANKELCEKAIKAGYKILEEDNAGRSQYQLTDLRKVLEAVEESLHNNRYR